MTAFNARKKVKNSSHRKISLQQMLPSLTSDNWLAQKIVGEMQPVGVALIYSQKNILKNLLTRTEHVILSRFVLLSFVSNFWPWFFYTLPTVQHIQPQLAYRKAYTHTAPTFCIPIPANGRTSVRSSDVVGPAIWVGNTCVEQFFVEDVYLKKKKYKKCKRRGKLKNKQIQSMIKRGKRKNFKWKIFPLFECRRLQWRRQWNKLRVKCLGFHEFYFFLPLIRVLLLYIWNFSRLFFHFILKFPIFFFFAFNYY